MSENEEQGYIARRERVDANVGMLVQSRGTVYRIAELLDFETVIAVSVDTGKSAPLRIEELESVDVIADYEPFDGDIAEIGGEDWKEAERRYAAIKPLLVNRNSGRAQVEARAAEVGVDTATLYRWLGRYRGVGAVSSLVPRSRGWKPGRTRISEHTEKVIQEVIDDFYLTAQRPSVQKAVVEARRRCHIKNVDMPSPGTVRNRIRNISEKRQLRGRGFREKAANKFVAKPGKFPNADYPLAVVQIDHTPADIIVVDDVHRREIGRPWITVAIDVYSRMVTGFYISLDPPSATSVGLCVAHSVLEKESWLRVRGSDAEWPVWGYPKTIHADNGADFRSDSFRRSCLTHGIHMEFRPVKQPHFGGHIERLAGTLMAQLHDLPGSTFSSVAHKDGYDSEKHAVMTRAEVEDWMIEQVCNIYHRTKHSGIGMTPIKKMELGVFGSEGEYGTGLPERPQDPHTVYLDFLPSFERTIQSFGVTNDGMKYYADALQPWINSSVPGNPKQKRKFLFRRDPRDISAMWFYDPDLKQYFQVPFADQALPPVSIWEYKIARKKALKEGNGSVNEAEVFAAITRQRERVEKSAEKTKKARRAAQRGRDHRGKVGMDVGTAHESSSKTVKETSGFSDNLKINFENEIE